MLAWLHIITGKVKEAEELLTRFRVKAQQENAERIPPEYRYLSRSFVRII